jgi:hypothetical protein
MKFSKCWEYAEIGAGFQGKLCICGYDEEWSLTDTDNAQSKVQQ